MNNNNNEEIVPITPITPTNGEVVNNVGQAPEFVVTPTTTMTTDNNAGNQNIEINSVSPEPSVITPVPNIVRENSNIQNTNSVISVVPESIVPESKESTPNIQTNLSKEQPNTLKSELKIEDSNPFDIGISGNNISPKTSSENITPTPIEPTTINNSNMNENVTIASSNVNKESNVNQTVSNSTSNEDNIVSVGKYLGHIILFSIPIVGFIMLIVKALNKKDKNISNFAKAELILGVIIVILGIVFSIVFGVTSLALGNNESDDTIMITDYDY